MLLKIPASLPHSIGALCLLLLASACATGPEYNPTVFPFEIETATLA